ncbi:MAG: hypothetical protein E3J71_09595 [Candidatus Stahlbacteria bacterium]|nr:MAG: hypothetical protein E3J71_09595 [Candidatus Stahlbacteria bacterium]
MKRRRNSYLRTIGGIVASSGLANQEDPTMDQKARRIAYILQQEEEKVTADPSLESIEEQALDSFKYKLMFRPQKNPYSVIKPIEIFFEITNILPKLFKAFRLIGNKMSDAKKLIEKIASVKLCYRSSGNVWGIVEPCDWDAWQAFDKLEIYLDNIINRLKEEKKKK